jgi:hypothetical protein
VSPLKESLLKSPPQAPSERQAAARALHEVAEHVTPTKEGAGAAAGSRVAPPPTPADGHETEGVKDTAGTGKIRTPSKGLTDLLDTSWSEAVEASRDAGAAAAAARRSDTPMQQLARGIGQPVQGGGAAKGPAPVVGRAQADVYQVAPGVAVVKAADRPLTAADLSDPASASVPPGRAGDAGREPQVGPWEEASGKGVKPKKKAAAGGGGTGKGARAF